MNVRSQRKKKGKRKKKHHLSCICCSFCFLLLLLHLARRVSAFAHVATYESNSGEINVLRGLCARNLDLTLSDFAFFLYVCRGPCDSYNPPTSSYILLHPPTVFICFFLLYLIRLLTIRFFSIQFFCIVAVLLHCCFFAMFLYHAAVHLKSAHVCTVSIEKYTIGGSITFVHFSCTSSMGHKESRWINEKWPRQQSQISGCQTVW